MATNTRGDLDGDASRPSEVARGNLVPLNSKRLTGVLLKQLAAALDVPTTATTEDLRRLINGKLTDLGREPMNVQVVLQRSSKGTTLTLRDVGGDFMEAKPVESESEDDGDGEGGGGEETNVESLREALHTMGEEKNVLS